MKRSLSLLILIVLLFVAAACGGGNEEPAASATTAPTSAAQQGSPAQQPEQPAATNTPVPATATPLPPTATPAAEEEVTLSEEQLAALEALDSYRLVVNYTSKGTDSDGNPIDDSAEIVTEYVKDPEARRMTMTFSDSTDPSAAPNSMETYQIGQDMYMYGGEDVGWLRISTEESPFADPELSMLTSGSIFSDLDQMRRVRPDQAINGIDSRHYQYDEKVLGKIFGDEMNNITANGDVWVAKDGGFVTKYLLTVKVNEGSGGLFDPNMTTGTIEMSFELQDVNEDITIELPEEAMASANLSGFDGPFPMPEGSSVQAASSSFTIINSDTPVADAITFYDAALADLGWTKDEQGSMAMGEDMASLAFAKDGVQLSLIITLDSNSGKTQIMASTQ